MYSKQDGIVVHNNTDGNTTNDNILSNKNIISLIIFQDGLTDQGGGKYVEMYHTGCLLDCSQDTDTGCQCWCVTTKCPLGASLD